MRHLHADHIIAAANDVRIEWQFKAPDSHWTDILGEPNWNWGCEYRQRPVEREPFDLARARAGEDIETKTGVPVKVIAYVPEATNFCQLVILIGTSIETRYLHGRYHHTDHTDYDIVMSPPLPSTEVRWVNFLPLHCGMRGEWLCLFLRG